QATNTIPIVVASCNDDMVETGIVASLSHPGGKRHWAFQDDAGTDGQTTRPTQRDGSFCVPRSGPLGLRLFNVRGRLAGTASNGACRGRCASSRGGAQAG